VVGPERAQLTLTAVDFGLELIDEPQACLHRPQSGLRQAHLGQATAPGDAEQI